MMTERMKQITIGIVAIILVIVIAILIANPLWNKQGFGNDENTSGMINTTLDASVINLNIQTSLENIKIQAKAPEPLSFLSYYRAYYAPGDVQEKKFGDIDKERFNLTTVEKAPDLARKAMEDYGGIPSDAYVSLSVINKAIIGDLKNPTEIKYFNNQVYFSRTINGIPITGMDDGIIVWLGDNGELLRYHRFWRTLEKVGDIPVVPVDKAIQKMEKREMMNPPQSPTDALVNSINLRYYAKSWNDKEIYLEPVYEFYATLPNGHDYQFYIYARQFAGFSQTPATTKRLVAGKSVEEKDPFTATFTDTSDANPVKWLWDFGDGTTSTEQNPTHTYKAAGTYDVTLTVWNDLGSDTMTQQYVVEDVAWKKDLVKESVTVNETVVETTPVPVDTITVAANTTTIPETTITVDATTAIVVQNETVTIMSSSISINET